MTDSLVRALWKCTKRHFAGGDQDDLDRLDLAIEVATELGERGEEIKRLRAEVKELEEYKSMYEGLCK